MTAGTFRCSEASEARSEPLYGTASHVRRWLLLEQPGSWGSDALLQSRLPSRAARELRTRARSHGVRIVLIRRGVRLSSPKRRCYLAVTETDSVFSLARLDLDGIDDLLDVDLGPLTRGGAVPGSIPHKEPLFLVCTHGRHDACCSTRGNQVSRVACGQPDLDAWECSHIGGDRFAANVVGFPHGIYYGRVGADEVLRLTGAYRDGTISLEHYRGRCCYPFALQAAEYFARRETNTTRIDDVRLLTSSAADGGLAASFTLPRRSVTVRVRIAQSASRHRLTCNVDRAAAIPTYELESFEEMGGDDA